MDKQKNKMVRIFSDLPPIEEEGVTELKVCESDGVFDEDTVKAISKRIVSEEKAKAAIWSMLAFLLAISLIPAFVILVSIARAVWNWGARGGI